MGLLGMLGGGGQQPQQQPLQAYQPPANYTIEFPSMDSGAGGGGDGGGGTDWASIFSTMMDAINANNAKSADPQNASLTPPTNVSPVLTNDRPLGGMAPSPGLNLPGAAAAMPPATTEEGTDKKKVQNLGGMSIGLPT